MLQTLKISVCLVLERMSIKSECTHYIKPIVYPQDYGSIAFKSDAST